MPKYIELEKAINLFYPVDPENDGSDGCTTVLKSEKYSSEEIESMLSDLPVADVTPVVHGAPISKISPQKYEIYEQAGTGENGEVLYHKRIYVDEKNSAEYCPVCNKRLCSRFRSFCPNCGAKMDLEENPND